MQFWATFPENTKWKSYMLSWTKYERELQNNELWDTA